MKTTILAVSLVWVLSSCAQPPKITSAQRVVDSRASSRWVDICDRKSMPKFSNRPRLTGADLSGLGAKEMDKKVQDYIKDLNRHIDRLESVIIRTRDRVQECR